MSTIKPLPNDNNAINYQGPDVSIYCNVAPETGSAVFTVDKGDHGIRINTSIKDEELMLEITHNEEVAFEGSASELADALACLHGLKAVKNYLTR